MNQAARTSKTRNRKIVFLLALLAALHVFIFSASFPFFSAVDEQMHIDLVVHYSHADIPRTLTPPDTNALPFICIYGSPEYLQTTGSISTPLWKQPMASAGPGLVARMDAYRTIFQNHEAASPPLYYSMAGAWWRLGKLFSFDGLSLLYWLRFLNVPLVFTLVWVGGMAARKVFPDDDFLQIAVPALIAFLPQTMFYTVDNDIVSPLAFGVAFVLLLNFLEAESPGPRLAAATGLALAATFLTKISNLPLIAVSGGFLALKIFSLWRGGGLRASSASLMVLLLCAALPMMAWMAWCRLNFGDFTGSAEKIRFLNWTYKPVAEWLHHPMFTTGGFWFFLKNNLATFWQGEELWRRLPMANPSVNSAYAVLSLGALALTLAALLRPRSGFTTPQRRALAFGLLSVVAMFAFFALLSVKYDFQDCFYPSREHPFFISGRLMLGMLIPFLVVFAAGLERLMKNFQAPTKFFVLVMLLGFMLACEIATDLPVFASDYNWFHM